jgi:L-lactate dehydrogenase complex protein LldE
MVTVFLPGDVHRRNAPMKVGLFIPCYIDAFFPEVGVAALQLLEKLSCSVEYPLEQTCCGQPMANSGCQENASATEALFVECFKDFGTVVGPSGSCVHHVRFHLDAIEQTPETRKVRAGTRELVEFLPDDLKVSAFPWAAFPRKVRLHDSCTALRGLGHARPSERVNEPYFSKTRDLLGKIAGLELVEIVEHDSLGPVNVPADKLWGAQTQRSLEHFSIGDDLMPREMIPAYAIVKKAAALVNHKAGRLGDTSEGPDRPRLRRDPGGPAPGPVPAARLDDRQRHPVQHERQRGDRQPLLADRRISRSAARSRSIPTTT